METGTQIILQRMIDCPEEFPSEGEYHSKWGRLIQDARNYLPKEDIEALDAGYKQLLIDRYNERVLRTLAGESGNLEESYPTIKASKQYAIGATDPRGLFGNAIAKQEGAMVGTLQDHAAQHNQRVEQLKVEQARAMQNSYGTGTSMGLGGLMNSAGLWGGK